VQSSVAWVGLTMLHFFLTFLKCTWHLCMMQTSWRTALKGWPFSVIGSAAVAFGSRFEQTAITWLILLIGVLLE
jgi:TRAP-type C4-dicarboxylate transport system permease small subunit